MRWIVGIDEVGRGPIAGPVMVCAVAISAAVYRRRQWQGLTDSKQMTVQARDHWEKEARQMKKQGQIRIAVASRSAAAIDRCGIALCIHECVVSVLRQLGLTPQQCEVRLDGSLFAPKEYTRQQTIIKGDSKEQVISMASVIAKVRRDVLMTRFAKLYPYYRWGENKGYGTVAHYKALERHGLSPLHRKSFLKRYLTK